MIHEGLTDAFHDIHMGVTAENLVERYGISRADQDAFAAESQRRAESAIKSGAFKDEIVPVVVPGKKGETRVDTDEHPRPGTTAESLAKLKPAFKKDGTVTAGNCERAQRRRRRARRGRARSGRSAWDSRRSRASSRTRRRRWIRR